MVVRESMKRILVIDESEVVRETLALILGREFVVMKRPLGAAGIKFSEPGHDVDLLILGVTPAIGLDAPSLLRLAARAPFAVLFLVDSRTAARAVSEQDRISCLVKPFNPYELRQKVGELLARRAILPKSVPPGAYLHQPDAQSYLTFPFLSRTAATLIHRFASTRLPLLVSGEMGCGQEQVVRGLRALSADEIQSWTPLNGAGINAEYLAQKAGELAWGWRGKEPSATLLVENLDKIPGAGQSALLNFLEEQEAKCPCRLLATSKTDLLERVYEGNFLEPLYYKFATLTVTLLPLRDRREDIPLIASWFARGYAQKLGLADVTFAPGAKERLGNYLWFGNLNELETVIARTLAVQRKTRIDASDLIFVFTSDAEPRAVPELGEFTPTEKGRAETPEAMSVWSPSDEGTYSPPDRSDGRGTPNDLKPLIRELAHELKNPMVTIKTFAQLLGDRYQDENFRTRFQEVVGGDIERMDDLLEVMIEFTDFSQPRSTRISLEAHLRSILDEIGSECTKRQTMIRWCGNGASQEILADEDQLGYILKNVLLTVLSEVKMGSEVEVKITDPGSLEISYRREGARMASISHYFKVPSEAAEESVRPLRILLAKKLLERIGGGMKIDNSENDKEIIKMGFPVA
jgi:DNA-binding NtrC family response regulator